MKASLPAKFPIECCARLEYNDVTAFSVKGEDSPMTCQTPSVASFSAHRFINWEMLLLSNYYEFIEHSKP